MRTHIQVPGEMPEHQYQYHPPTLDPHLAAMQERYATPYLSPAAITTRPPGTFGIPYWTHGIAIQATDFFIGSAPQNIWSVNLPTPTQAIANNPGHGQAPTSGVYTGIVHEDHC